MKTRTVDIRLADGKFYVFSERFREDIDFSSVTSDLRKLNLKLIQETIADKDERLVLMLAEMKRTYTAEDIGFQILNRTELLQKMSYDSFKIANSGITFEDYLELLPKGELRNICQLINEIEADEPEKKKRTLAQRLGLTKR